MYIMKKNKKIIRVFCEGKTEKYYFEALKGNKIISNNYVLKPYLKTNDLSKAINKSKCLDGIEEITLFVYDSDVYKDQKKNKLTNDNINKNKKIYLFY